MKNEKNLMQMVIAGLLSVLIVVLVLGRGERVVIVNEGYSRPPVVSSSVTPQFGDNDPDWWQYVETIPEDNREIYKILKVEEVYDGDTFKVVLDWDETTSGESVVIRLAGVNCPERFDQVGWLPALETTNEFLFDENGATYEDLFFENIGSKSYDRITGFVTRGRHDDATYSTFSNQSYVEKTDNIFDLGLKLVAKGYALPCFGYLKRIDPTGARFAEHLKMAKMVWDIIDEDTIIDEDDDDGDRIKWKVWGVSNNEILLDITPYDINCIACKDRRVLSGDRIKITFDIEAKEYERELSGYSIVDESSRAANRFFLPSAKLKISSNKKDEDSCTKTPNIRIFSGISYDKDRKNAQSDAKCQPQYFMLSKTNIINNDGDSIFIRDIDRRIVAFSYWDDVSEHCFQSNELFGCLEDKDYLDNKKSFLQCLRDNIEE